VRLAKTTGLDLGFLTTYVGPAGKSSDRIAQAVHDNGPQLDDRILADPAVTAAISAETSVERSYDIINVDRCGRLELLELELLALLLLELALLQMVVAVHAGRGLRGRQR
jgi:hypothetical protein